VANITIFKHQTSVSTGRKRELSELTKSMLSRGLTTRRIQTSTNGTFKRRVNGEQIGRAIRGEFNAIIVGGLAEASRVYYAKQYDPDGEPTLPDCWSNLGDVTEEGAENPQAKSCATCPQNIKGSGTGDRRACRYQRRIAILLEGDNTGEVYQFNVPSKSLFGKGVGNDHPFESYMRFLAANQYSVEHVITNIRYNENADGMELIFSPAREITDEEAELVATAVADPETLRVCMLTVAAASKVTKQPEPEAAPLKGALKTKKEVKPKPSFVDEDEDEEVAVKEPPVRVRTKVAEPEVAVSGSKEEKLAAALSAWVDDDDD